MSREQLPAKDCFLVDGERFREIQAECAARIGMPLDRQISPIRSGLNTVDKITLGYHPSNITAVGGRPGTGKTSFATTVTANILKHSDQQVVYISTELPETRLVMQISEAFCGGIPTAPKNWELQEAQKTWLKEAQDYVFKCVREHRLSIIHQKRMNADFLVDVIRHHCEVLHKNEIALVIVDQMNRVKRDAKAGFGSYALASEDLMNRLEVIAEDEGVPMMLLSQLNRNADGRMKPTMADFKHTGAIEEFAHACILLHREDTEAINGEIIVAKTRDGAIGSVPARFDGAAHTWKEV